MAQTIWCRFEQACEQFAAKPFTADRSVSFAQMRHDVGITMAAWADAIEPGDRVSILDVNGLGFTRAYFAAAGLGAILNPLNHRLSRTELEAILDDARPARIVAGETFARVGRELAARFCVPFSMTRIQTAERSLDPGPNRSSIDDVAHLYYTSGTTGEPKGVQLTHRNVCTHADSAIAELGISGCDVWGHFAPMFHLADAWAVFAVTFAGGTHAFLPTFEARDALALMERERITLTNLVPTMLRSVVSAAEGSKTNLSLRRMLSGGAPIAPELVARVIGTLGCDYTQTYGMTETSPYLTLSLLDERHVDLDQETQLALKSKTGRPFRGVELEVVDDAGSPIAADDVTVGEIRVRGETISPGYWRKQDATRAVFRDGWLFTGDLATVDRFGFVNIVDRKKDMIITGGENVYSTEVENVLYEHPAVAECAVFGRPDERWGERVCAAIVPAVDGAVTGDELITFCREKIAGFKVPREFIWLRELPKTGSGKISKSALRDGGADADSATR